MFALRIPFAALAGAFVAVSLFVGLARLISVPFEAPSLEEAFGIEFTPQLVDTEANVKRPPRVEPKPPVREPNPPRIGLPQESGRVEPATFVRPTLQPEPARRGLALSGVDNDVVPRVRLKPVYPPHALARGIEGWVEVRFTVTAIGTVRDAVVVTSEPGNTFDEAALKAIAGWRYNPRVEKGEAVERVGLQTVIRFELEN